MALHKIQEGDTDVNGIFVAEINGVATAPDAVPTVVAGSEEVDGADLTPSVVTPSVEGSVIKYAIDSTLFVAGNVYAVALTWTHGTVVRTRTIMVEVDATAAGNAYGIG